MKIRSHSIISDFINYIEHIRRYSLHTVRSYKYDLNDYISFCYDFDPENNFFKLDQSAIQAYLQYVSQKGLSAKTLARRLASIKSLYKYMLKNKIVKDMESKNAKVRRISTVCWLIYRTAMRVGDEKDPEEADTVGATTLRKEHVTLTSDSIKFDFLGKDSVRWQETVPAVGNDKQFHENLKELTSKIKATDEIFGNLTSRDVNEYYKTVVNGLTAKVFRTFSASTVVSKYLNENGDVKKSSQMEKLYHAKLANLEAAIMCNHKRTIPKTFEQSLQKKRDTLKIAEKATPWKKNEETLKKAETTKTKTDAQEKKRKERISKIKQMIKKSKIKQKERVEKLRLQLDLTEKTKDYNLGTSLRNYIDPRIFKSWTDEVTADWEKLYTSALQKKFLWVKSENESWQNVSKHY